MAGRTSRGKSQIEVGIKADADFSAARKDIARDLNKIEADAKDTAEGIEDAFRQLSPELDTSEIRKALALADQLDGMTASFTVDTDLSEIRQAEEIAKSLRAFQGRVDLSVEGRAELKEALDLAGRLDGVRRVRLDVMGRQDLEKAEALIRDLDGESIDVKVDVDDSELKGLGGRIKDAGSSAGEGFASSFEGAADLADVGGDMVGQLTGALAMAGPWAAAAGGIAAMFGDDLMEGIADKMGEKKRLLLDAVRSGLPKAQLEMVGQEAGDAYADGFGESLSDLRETTMLLESSLRGVDEGLDLEESTKSAEALAELFGVDIPTGARMARDMVANGLAPDVERAYEIMASAAQKYGLDQEEIFDTAQELGPMWASMTMDGARGFQILGEAAAKGQLEVGQMAELFEEFTGQLTDGSLNETLRDIGLSAEEMQLKMATGRGAEAMRDITSALLEMKDPVARNTAAADIFGESWAKVADPEVMLQLLAQADALGEVTDALENGKVAIEESVTGWDRLGKSVESLGGVIGGTINSELARLYGSWDDLRGLFGDDEPVQTVTQSIRGLEGQLSSVRPVVADVAGEFDGMATSVDGLLAELEGLFNFTPDQLLRDIAEAGLSLAEALTADTAAAVGLNGAIDIGTESGRALQVELEGLNGVLLDNAEAAINGDITGRQFAATQRQIEADLMRAAAAAGLTTTQAEGLRAKYLELPASVNTDIRATDLASRPVHDIDAAYRALPGSKTTKVDVDDQASNPLRAIKDRIDAIQSKTVSVSTVTSSVRQLEQRHGGGDVKAGTPYLTGGPGAEELFIPGADGHVFTPAQTQAMARTGGAVASGGGARGGGGVLEIRSGGSALDDLLVEVLRKAVRNRGGVGVVFS